MNRIMATKAATKNLVLDIMIQKKNIKQRKDLIANARENASTNILDLIDL